MQGWRKSDAHDVGYDDDVGKDDEGEDVMQSGEREQKGSALDPSFLQPDHDVANDGMDAAGDDDVVAAAAVTCCYFYWRRPGCWILFDFYHENWMVVLFE